MAKKAIIRAPTIEIFPHGTDDGQVEQGSEDWLRLHIGVPSASNFATIMASGDDGEEAKTRRKLLFDMAGEILTGIPAEAGYKSAAMKRGNEMEPDARSRYAFENDCEVERIGFIRNQLPRKQLIGCSPDGLIKGTRRGLEIKTMIPRLMMEQAERPGLPPAFRAQVHGTMLVAELEEMHLYIFYRGMPFALTYLVRRDEVYLKTISNALEVFHYELAELVDRQRKRGGLPALNKLRREEEIPA